VVSSGAVAVSFVNSVALLWDAVAAQSPSPMLAQLAVELPRGEWWRYEPKFDGFRGLLHRSARGQTQLLSRNADLGPWFPELTRAAGSLPPGTLLDGEIVICDETGASNFGSLDVATQHSCRCWRLSSGGL
jgi:ATP-dependent DNA ligase